MHHYSSASLPQSSPPPPNSATFSSQPNCSSSSISSKLNEQSNYSVVNSIKSTYLSFKPSSLKILYFNTRSLLLKLDDLALICSSFFPDIVCISESWLSPDISDNEISIPNYHCVHKGRSHHGGGIAVYIKPSLSFKVIPSPLNLELILLSVAIHSSLALSIGLQVINGSLDILNDFLTSLNHDHMKKIFLTGDFNINFMSSSNQTS